MDPEADHPGETREYRAEEGDAGKRLDLVLAGAFPELSRAFIQKLLEDGHVFLHERPVKKSHKLHPGECLTLFLPEPEEIDAVPQEMPLEILYEDRDILVVNKEKGMVVHPSAGHPDHTLVNGILFHCQGELSGINGKLRPGIVHRIDKDTSGSLIICKTDAAHLGIAAQLKEHTIERVYHAILHGMPKEEAFTVDKPLGRDPKDRLRMAVVPGGKQAVTHVRLLERFQHGSEAYAYVECRLETGRTHQIRVHLAHKGFPLLGDPVYCPERLSRKEGRLGALCAGQCLHAKTLGFFHPITNERIFIDTALPSYFQEVLKILRHSG